MEVLQNPHELKWMRNIYRKQNPPRVLEIGCWDGGTLREWLTQSTPSLVVAVDLEHRNRGAYEDWRQPETELVLVTGRSQSPAAIRAMQAHAPYDWVFIDGDHGEHAVRADRDTCLPLVREGGTLVFHDICPGAEDTECGPRVVFDDLRDRGYRVREYIKDPQKWPWTHGVGVVEV